MLCRSEPVTPSCQTKFASGASEGMVLRTASPLTPPARPKPPCDQRTTVPLRRGEGPALSPLRGEGGARGVPGHLITSLRGGIALRFARGSKRTSRQFASPMNGSSTVRCDSDGPMPSTRYHRAVVYSILKEASDASPSPLNGERAGVRGEAVRRPVPSKTAQRRSHSPWRNDPPVCS
jgi:hypothetical protein